MMGIFSSRLLLSVRERLLLHLLNFQKYENEFEMPEELTQAGIAKSTGIARPNVSRAVKKLLDSGQIIEKLSHIKEHKRQKKIYLLTQSGLLLASELNDNLGRAKVKFKNPMGKFEELSLNEIISRVPDRRITKLQAINYLDNNGVLAHSKLSTANQPGTMTSEPARETTVTDRMGAGISGQFVHVESPPLLRRQFFGRSAELKKLNNWYDAHEGRYFLIHGIPGIGKTSIAIEFLLGRSEGTNTMWYGLKEWDSLANLLGNLSGFLERLGRKKLAEQLTEKKVVQESETADIIAEDLAGIPAIIVIDDFQNANPDIITFFRSVLPLLAHHTKLKILLLSRELIKFYDRRDVVLSGIVTELALGGLDEASCRKLLTIPGISQNDFSKLYNQTGGHPLYFELLNTAPQNIRERGENLDMMDFLHEEVFSKLTETEQGLMKMASIFRYPVYAEAFFDDPEISYSHIDSLVARSYLVRRGLNLYDTHDLIRAFFQSRLTRTERIKFHAAAASYYGELSGNLDNESILDSELDFFTESLLELQHHLISGGESEAALACALKYGRRLIDGGRFEFLVILDEFELDKLRPLERARILLYKGELYSRLGDLDDAKQALLQSRREFGSLGDNYELSMLEILIGENSAARGDWENAISNYEKAQKYLWGIAGPDRIEAKGYALARCYNDLALVLKKTGKPEDALRYYQQGLDLLESNGLGSIHDRAAIMENLGLIFIELNRPEYARDYFNRAIAVLEEEQDYGALAKLLATVGEVYVELGDIKSATRFFEKGVHFWEMAEDAGKASETFIRLGQIFTQNIGTPAALAREGAGASYWHRLQKLFSDSEQADRAKISQLYDRIGSLYMHRGFWHKSLEFHKKALDLFTKLNDDRGCAKVYNNLGVLYRTQQEPVRALESYKKALEYLTRLGELRGLAITHLNIGRLYERLDKPDESKKAYEDCILAVSADENMMKLSGLALLGLARQSRPGSSGRTRYLKKAEEIFRRLDDRQNLGEVERLGAER